MRVGILGIKSIPATMGADRVVEALLGELPQKHRYTVYVMREHGREPEGSGHVRLVRVPALRGKHLGAASYFALSSLHAAFVGRFDVVHVHNSDFGAFCLPLRLRRKSSIVGTFHGDPYAREKWGGLAKTFLRFSERCFVRASNVLTSVTPVKHVQGREVRYIPNGIDPWTPSVGTADALCDRLGVPSEGFVMFACGRLDPTKGLHHLLEAWSGLPDAPPLLAIADFRHDRTYSERIRALAGGDDRVVLHDRLLPRDQLLGLVSRARVFVFPSEVEGMAMMLLEAISTRAPIVCSDIPENVAVVGPDYPFLFSSGSANSLSSILEQVLSAAHDPEISVRLCEDVLRRFQWARAAHEYARLYELCHVATERRRHRPTVLDPA